MREVSWDIFVFRTASDVMYCVQLDTCTNRWRGVFVCLQADAYAHPGLKVQPNIVVDDNLGFAKVRLCT